LEKKNDLLKTVYHRHTNKKDSAFDCLRVMKRREFLDSYERSPRQYKKVDADIGDKRNGKETGINASATSTNKAIPRGNATAFRKLNLVHND
jgi:hypothetical protein